MIETGNVAPLRNSMGRYRIWIRICASAAEFTTEATIAPSVRKATTPQQINNTSDGKFAGNGMPYNTFGTPNVPLATIYATDAGIFTGFTGSNSAANATYPYKINGTSISPAYYVDLSDKLGPSPSI